MLKPIATRLERRMCQQLMVIPAICGNCRVHHRETSLLVIRQLTLHMTLTRRAQSKNELEIITSALRLWIKAAR